MKQTLIWHNTLLEIASDENDIFNVFLMQYFILQSTNAGSKKHILKAQIYILLHSKEPILIDFNMTCQGWDLM